MVYPGWVNTHHHLFQNLLKAVPSGMNAGLEQWLASVAYPRLERFTPEIFRTAVRLGMAELLLSGTTTCADHHYLYHHGHGAETGDVLFEVAEELGMTPNALRVALHRLRDRYRLLLRQMIADTVSDEGEVDDEIRYLMEVLRS